MKCRNRATSNRSMKASVFYESSENGLMNKLKPLSRHKSIFMIVEAHQSLVTKRACLLSSCRHSIDRIPFSHPIQVDGECEVECMHDIKSINYRN